jgi:response regulator of citrate/malate metabolism
MDLVEKRKLLSDFDARLRALAKDAPTEESRRDVNRLINKFRRRHCVPYQKKKEEVLRKIADGASSFDELCEETGFARRFISKILDELVQGNQIRVEKFSYRGTGRPRTLYLPIEKQ